VKAKSEVFYSFFCEGVEEAVMCAYANLNLFWVAFPVHEKKTEPCGGAFEKFEG
jgi:hypothetical protein